MLRDGWDHASLDRGKRRSSTHPARFAATEVPVFRPFFEKRADFA
jgi:hypothetical protein